MTPKQYFTEEGEPFPVTVLDDRAGIRQPQGNYVLAEDESEAKRLPEDVYAQVRQRAEKAEKRIISNDPRRAFNLLVEAIELLPEPFEQWNAAGWLLVALGENAIRAADFSAAEQPLSDAMSCPGTLGNPWVHLRLGQVQFEAGEMKRAADELARAYMGGGREIFEGQDPKYLNLVEETLEPPPGMDRLP